MRLVLFAYHDIGCRAIETLLALKQDIACVFTHEDDPGENLWFGSVQELARKKNIPVHTPPSPNTPEWVEQIKKLNPDAIFSFYYRQLIKDEILSIPPKGAYNLHGSLLPRYRGRAPVNWVIVNGEKETGLTLHHMVKRADAGDIVAQKSVPISDDDTALTLYHKLVPVVETILRETVPLIESGRAPRIAQDESKAALVRGRKPEDGLINWTSTAQQIYNLVRAVTHPYPGAFTFYQGKKLLVWKCSKTAGKGTPGTILSADPLTVACGENAVILETVQPEHGAESSGKIWCSQNKIKTGSRLGG